MAWAGILAWATCIAVISAAAAVAPVDGIGVNWGTMASHPMDPTSVVDMLKASGIKRVKLFDADPSKLGALAGTSIEVMLGIPNDQLDYMSSKLKHARSWVKENVTSYVGKVNIKYVAVGNEPFLTSYNGIFTDSTFPALRNIHKALNDSGLGQRIKATVPFNADVYSSPANNPIPSAGNFRPDIRHQMTQIVHHLNSHNAPFLINIYPYISLYQDPNFPVDYAFFDGTASPLSDRKIRYTNVFDANYDTLVWSLKKARVPDLKIIVGEIGWPTDGDKRATLQNAKRFYDGFFRKLAANKGTPMRPGRLDAYLFSLFDEDMKSVLPGNFERHWGIFSYDGKPKFRVNFTGRYLVGAKGVQHLPRQWCVLDAKATDKYGYVPASVDYACSNADCTALGYGSSCGGMSAKGNASYAFNAYFQAMDQDARACDFHGLARIVTDDPSRGKCRFPIQIMSGSRESGRGRVAVTAVAMAVILVVLFV